MSEPITATEREDRLRAAAGGCRMLSEGDKCDCGLCRRDEEIKRLRTERDGPRGYVETATRLRAEVERLNDVVARLNRVAEGHVASLETEVERLKAALAYREAEGGE